MAMTSDLSGGVKKTKTRPVLTYTNQGAIRNRKLKPALFQAIEKTVRETPGIARAEIFSGGQRRKNNLLDRGRRTGSINHDDGNAADVRFYDKNNRIIRTDTKKDIPIIAEAVSRARKNGVTGGIGAGAGYMGGRGVHLGYGPKIVWGKNGRSKNAPAWLNNAASGKAVPNNIVTGRNTPPPVKQKRTVVIPEAERTPQQKADVAMGRPAPTKTIEVDVEQQAAIDTGNRIQTQLPKQQRGGLFGGFAKVPGVEGAGTTTASQIASSLGSSARNRSNVMNMFGAPHRNNKTLGEIDV